MQPFKGLNARHFIATDHMFSLCSQERGLRIQVAECLDLLGEFLRIDGLGIEPVAGTMGLERCLTPKNARRYGPKCLGQSRV